eukprot:4242022-Prorocentrum_lima.AAC.1
MPKSMVVRGPCCLNFQPCEACNNICSSRLLKHSPQQAVTYAGGPWGSASLPLGSEHPCPE